MKVWQEAMSVAELVYRLTTRFPKDEVYGMTSQIRRVAVSIAANIAEGHGRENSGSFVQFLRMSQGSLKELETHLVLAQRVNLATGKDVRTWPDVALVDPIDTTQNSPMMILDLHYSLLAIRYSLLTGGPAL